MESDATAIFTVVEGVHVSGKQILVDKREKTRAQERSYILLARQDHAPSVCAAGQSV